MSEISSFLIIAFIKFLEIPLNILEIIVGKLLISLLLFEALLGDDRFKCSLKSSKSFNSRKLILLDVGKVYFVCGNISLKFSSISFMCLKLSIIIFESSNKIMLLCFPINSITSFLEIISSNSSNPSNSSIISLSKSNVIMFFNFNPIRFFRNNIQKFGATCGFAF